jgi:hypothetical protein
MRQSRRALLSGALNLTAAVALGQGVVVHQKAAQPRAKRSGLPFNARFVDVAGKAGIDHPVLYGSPQRKDYIIESVGCGCAFVDYDNDGWIDILVLGGSDLASPTTGISNRLYHNNRNGTFRDITIEAGLTKTGWACGACVGDYNNDGFEDLFLTYWGTNVLYRNNGNGTFTDVTQEAGLHGAGARWGSGCTFFDYDRDGNLDLFVSNYVDFNYAKTPRPGEKPCCFFQNVPVNCGPPAGYIEDKFRGRSSRALQKSGQSGF